MAHLEVVGVLLLYFGSLWGLPLAVVMLSTGED